MSKPIVRLTVIASILWMSSPAPADGQSIIAPLYPRRVEQGRVADSLRLRATRLGRTLSQLSMAQVDSARSGSTRPVVLSRDDAALLWASDDVTLLPAASISPGKDATSVYTELAAALSGDWRVAIGTTLSVGAQEEPAEETESAASEEGAGFNNFLAGGGNLSLTGVRPLYFANNPYDSHLVLFVPRAWTNIPSLDSTSEVTNFGGEAAIELQYQRYERAYNADGQLADKPKAPFLSVHARVGAVYGSSDFFETVGRGEDGLFVYTVPTINLSFANGVRLGASYFWGFGALDDHESIRLHLTLAPPRTEGEDDGR